MKIELTAYFDVISSWCYWAEPTWAALKERYEGRAEFHWKIALMDASGLPTSRAQLEWYYRRSAVMMRAPFHLESGWFEAGWSEYIAPNAVAEAARDLGIDDDRARLALAHAAVREGRRVGQWEIAADVVAAAVELDRERLLERARRPDIEERLRASTAEFHALKATQRPAIVVNSPAGEQAIFSGVVTLQPYVATVDSMLRDLDDYACFGAQFGSPPME